MAKVYQVLVAGYVSQRVRETYEVAAIDREAAADLAWEQFYGEYDSPEYVEILEVSEEDDERDEPR